MPRTLTDKGVAALKSRAKRYAKSDPELHGLWIRVQPTGPKSYYAVTRNPQGKQPWVFFRPAQKGRCIARQGRLADAGGLTKNQGGTKVWSSA